MTVIQCEIFLALNLFLIISRSNWYHVETWLRHYQSVINASTWQVKGCLLWFCSYITWSARSFLLFVPELHSLVTNLAVSSFSRPSVWYTWLQLETIEPAYIFYWVYVGSICCQRIGEFEFVVSIKLLLVRFSWIKAVKTFFFSQSL